MNPLQRQRILALMHSNGIGIKRPSIWGVFLDLFSPAKPACYHYYEPIIVSPPPQVQRPAVARARMPAAVRVPRRVAAPSRPMPLL